MRLNVSRTCCRWARKVKQYTVCHLSASEPALILKHWTPPATHPRALVSLWSPLWEHMGDRKANVLLGLVSCNVTKIRNQRRPHRLTWVKLRMLQLFSSAHQKPTLPQVVSLLRLSNRADPLQLPVISVWQPGECLSSGSVQPAAAVISHQHKWPPSPPTLSVSVCLSPLAAYWWCHGSLMCCF